MVERALMQLPALAAVVLLLSGCATSPTVGLDCAVFAGYVFEATVPAAGFTLELQSGPVVGPFFPSGADAWNQTRAALMDGTLVKVTACERDDGRSYYDRIEVGS